MPRSALTEQLLGAPGERESELATVSGLAATPERAETAAPQRVSTRQQSMEEEISEKRKGGITALFPPWTNTQVLKKDLTGTFQAQETSTRDYAKTVGQSIVKAIVESVGLKGAIDIGEHLADGEAMDELHEALESSRAGDNEKLDNFLRNHGVVGTNIRKYGEQMLEQFISDTVPTDLVQIGNTAFVNPDSFKKSRTSLYYKNKETRSLLLLQEKQKRLTYALLKLINILEQDERLRFNGGGERVIDAQTWWEQQDLPTTQLIKPFIDFKENMSEPLVRDTAGGSFEMEESRGVPIPGVAEEAEEEAEEESRREVVEVEGDEPSSGPVGRSPGVPRQTVETESSGHVGGGYKKTKKKKTQKRKKKTKKKRTQKRKKITKKKRTQKKRIYL